MTESNWLARRLAAIRTSKQRSGDAAEQQALLHLQAQGLRLLQRSFLCKGGEIDLIMRDDKHVVFIEVRQRSSKQFGGALASITLSKQKRLVHAAQVYLKNMKPLPPCRFDVVAFEGEELIWLQNVITG
ncbi:YraN family protein [Undibacterium sp.]|uniref:YraN family protein n=1 Tax=Undibacterium sp. TaxID=1914977 RepID=UPI0037523FBD